MDDIIGAGGSWIPQAQYEMIQAAVPVLCVDVVLHPAGFPRQAGLIRRAGAARETWCMIGGRVLRDEPLPDAVSRHVRARTENDCQ
jgi:ADP-ribose pyrophosphatase YjhB (NUDIX family)